MPLFITLMLRRQLASQAEALAKAHLLKKGCKIIDQNVRLGRGEVDLIAIQDNFLLFIEVKLRTNIRFGYGENFVSPRQQALYYRLAEYYVEKLAWKHAIRFDIIAFHPEGKAWKLVYFEDAF